MPLRDLLAVATLKYESSDLNLKESGILSRSSVSLTSDEYMVASEAHVVLVHARNPVVGKAVRVEYKELVKRMTANSTDPPLLPENRPNFFVFQHVRSDHRDPAKQLKADPVTASSREFILGESDAQIAIRNGPAALSDGDLLAMPGDAGMSNHLPVGWSLVGWAWTIDDLTAMARRALMVQHVIFTYNPLIRSTVNDSGNLTESVSAPDTFATREAVHLAQNMRFLQPVDANNKIRKSARGTDLGVVVVYGVSPLAQLLLLQNQLSHPDSGYFGQSSYVFSLDTPAQKEQDSDPKKRTSEFYARVTPMALVSAVRDHGHRGAAGAGGLTWLNADATSSHLSDSDLTLAFFSSAFPDAKEDTKVSIVHSIPLLLTGTAEGPDADENQSDTQKQPKKKPKKPKKRK